MAKGNAVGQKTACKRPPATPAKEPKLAPGKDNTFKITMQTKKFF